MKLKQYISKYIDLDHKYDISFYFSFIARLVMVGMSIYSALVLSPRYYGLVALYGWMLLIRSITFLINRDLIKRNDDSKELFKKKHFLMLFASLMLVAFFIISFFINTPSASLENQSKPVFIVYAFVVPWAVIRTAIEVSRVVRLKSNHDPYYITKIIVNFITVVITILCALTDVLIINQNNIPLVIVMFVIIILLLLYWVSFSIYLFVVSIRGLLNKRTKQEALFIKEQALLKKIK